MDTEIRAYKNAVDSADRCHTLLMQTRTIQQVKAQKVKDEIQDFVAFLRVHVFERVLRQRNNRMSRHSWALRRILKEADSEDGRVSLSPADFQCPLSAATINFLSKLLFSENVLTEAAQQRFEFVRQVVEFYAKNSRRYLGQFL